MDSHVNVCKSFSKVREFVNIINNVHDCIYVSPCVTWNTFPTSKGLQNDIMIYFDGETLPVADDQLGS